MTDDRDIGDSEATGRRKRVLIVGTGSIGERHVRCFLGTGRVELAICEVNKALGQSVAQKYGVSHCFTSLENALQQNRYDAAVICTPANLHIDLAIQLLNSGSDLLIEKPLSTRLSDAERLSQYLQRGDEKRIAGVAYVTRNHPLLIEMRSALLSGEFGRPLQIVGVSGQHFPTYRPAYRDIYYARHETGGGAIQDALTHTMNAAHWLVGKVDRLVADAEHQALPDVEVEDTVHVITRHANVLGNFSLNQHQPANESTLTVICEQAMVRFEMHRGRWQVNRKPDEAWETRGECQLERDDVFVRQANAFLDAIETRDAERLPCGLDDAVHTLAINVAILESWRRQQWQNVSPDITASDERR